MKFYKFLTFSIIFLISLLPICNVSAQCTDGSQPECTCETAPILCSVDELDGYTFSMSSYQHPDDGPTPICTNANNSRTDNPTWFAFAAWCTDLTLEASFSNCVGNAFAIGVQIAIYKDCSFTEQVACNVEIQNCNTNNKILEMTDLEVGGIYYFLVDGCLGSYCDVEIDILGVCGEQEIAGWTEEIFGNINPCHNNSEEYYAEELLGATQYSWFLDGALINVSTSPSLTFPWSTPGTFELCIDASNDPCVLITNNPPPLCTTIVVTDPDAGSLIVSPTLLCTNEVVEISSVDFSENENTVQVILITDDSGDIVEIIEAISGTFSSSLNGLFTVYAYNYVIGTSEFLEVGDNINSINCNVQCCDLENVDLIFQDISVFVSNIICNDNGTNDNPDDDVYFFDLLVTGSSSLESWVLTTDNSVSGQYNIPLNLGPFLINDGLLEFAIQDLNSPICQAPVSVVPPVSCSLCDFDILIDSEIDVLSCTNTSVELTGSATGNGDAQWTGPNGFVDNNLITTGTDPGWYFLSVDFSNNCILTDSILVDIDTDLPLIDAGIDQAINCNSLELTLEGLIISGDNLDLEWSDPSGVVLGNSSILSVNTPGTYTFQVTDPSNGCSVTDEVSVSLDNEAPLADGGADQTINCNNMELSLDASNSTGGALVYEWISPSGALVANTATTTVNASGTYTLLVTNTENGCTSTDVVVIDLDTEAPTAQAGLDQIIDCSNLEITLDGSSSVGSNLLYEWMYLNGVVFSTASSVTVNSPGMINLQITDTSNGCTDTDQVLVEIDTNIPSANAGADQSIDCNNSEVTLDGSASIGNNLEFEWLNSAGIVISNTSTVIVSFAGVYTLQVTDSNNGCTTTDEVLVSFDNDMPSAIAGSDQIINCINAEATLDGTATEGADLQYEWISSSGIIVATEPITTVVEPGVYVLLVTDLNNGCVTEDEVIVALDVQVPVANAGVDQTIDCAISDIGLEGSSDSNNNVYAWTNADGTMLSNGSILEVNTAGIYTLLVTNPDNGCTATDEVQVVNNDALPTANAGADQILNCDIAEVVLEGTGGGGSSLIYEWTNELGEVLSSAENVSVNIAGVYYLEVTDTNNGCSTSDEVLVEDDFRSPTVNAGFDQIINCSNVEATLVGSGSTGNNFIYEWTNLAGSIIANTPTTTVDVAGTYILQITDTTNGCSITDEVLVEIDNDTPVANAGEDQVLDCITSEVVLNSALSIGDNLEYKWINADGTVISTAPSTTVNTAGVYTLQITDSFNGCTIRDEVLVVLDNAAPPTDAGLDQVLDCNNIAVTLGEGANADSNFIYEWSDLSGSMIGEEFTVVVSEPGAFTLQITDLNNGCSALDDVIVTLNDTMPTANAGLDQVIDCINLEAILDGSEIAIGNLEYQWFSPTGEEIATTFSTVVLEAGIYSLQVTNPANGCSDFDEMVVLIDTLSPIAEAGDDRILDCINLEVTLDGSLSVGENLNYNWINSAGSTISDLPIVNVNESGNYTLQVTNENNGCSSSDAILVIQDDEVPTANAGPNQIISCEELEVELDGSASTLGNVLIDWTSPAGAVVGNSATVIVTVPGTYILQITNTMNGCTDTDEVLVQIDNKVPIAIAGPDQIIGCSTTEITLDGSASTGDNLDFVWTDLFGEVISSMSSVTVSIAGIYTLQVTDRNNGCTTFDEVIISDIIQPLGLGNVEVEDEICLGDNNGSIDLTAFSSGLPPFTYTLNGGITNNSGVFLNLAPGEYQIQIVDANGCILETIIDIFPGIEFDLLLTDTLKLNNGQIANIFATTDINPVDINQVLWSPPNILFCDTCLNTIYDGDENQSLNLTVWDENGCMNTESIYINIIPDPSIYIPNAFSPNKDGINDIFMIFANDQVENIDEFEIYNRWGESIFKQSNIAPNEKAFGWDGMYRGQLLDSGVFVYYIKLTTVQGDTQLISGDVLLMR